MQQLIWLNKKPYFLHKVGKKTDEAYMFSLRKKYPTTKYFYVKTYNAKTKEEEIAIYLDKIVHYEN